MNYNNITEEEKFVVSHLGETLKLKLYGVDCVIIGYNSLENGLFSKYTNPIIVEIKEGILKGYYLSYSITDLEVKD